MLGGALKVGGDMWTAAGGEDDVPRRDDARAPLGVVSAISCPPRRLPWLLKYLTRALVSAAR